jgi:hypothetical protein
MARVTYKGDHAAVFVVVNGAPAVEAKRGEPVEVPAGLARSLVDSPVWVEATDDKPAKRHKGAKTDDPANHAENGG